MPPDPRSVKGSVADEVELEGRAIFGKELILRVGAETLEYGC